MWLDELKDKRARVRIAASLRQAEAGSLGDGQPVEGEETIDEEDQVAAQAG